MTSPCFTSATESIAACARCISAAGSFGMKNAGRNGTAAGLAALLLAGCASFVDKPMRPVLYDFGPGVAIAPPETRQDQPQTALSATREATPSDSTRQGGQAALLLAEIEATGALDGSAVLYRLGYADANQLRPYAQSRWSVPPPQLVRQRLRERLGRDRVMLNPGEGAALARTNGALPRVLRIELEEFSQYFESPVLSTGLLRLRATVLESTAAGERLLAQRSLVVQRPAASPDAPGGVRALAAATDAAAEEIGQWLRQLR